MTTTLDTDRRAIVSWCAYDWANSAFSTLIVTFIYSTYFSGAFAATADEGTVLWSRGIVISALLVAALSPIVGAVADRSGRRRRYLIIATLVCCAFTILLAFVEPGSSGAAVRALTVFVIANVAFEMAMVFYNAFLPAIAPAGMIGRISGWGWAAGYFAGIASMALALYGFVGAETPWFGIPADGDLQYRVTNLLVAGWFLVFAIPMFLFVRDTGPGGSADIPGAFREIGRTFRNLGRYREVAKFLLARLIYNDGLVTLISFAGIFAAGSFGLSLMEVTFFGMALNVAAGLGAFAFGFVDDRLGGRKTILISLAALCVAVLIGVSSTTRLGLWAAGIVIGIFLGPTQAASRSLMGRFTPAEHQNEFFGFYAFSGKATAFLGPMVLGLVTGWFGQRVGVTTVIGFFVVGGAILTSVNEERGIAAADARNASVGSSTP